LEVKAARRLAFVALWALFGIELISGNAEDIVALGADAMDEGRGRLGGTRNVLRSGLTGSVGSLGHGEIVAWGDGEGWEVCGEME